VKFPRPINLKAKTIARGLFGDSLYRLLATVRRAKHDRRVGGVDDVRRSKFYQQWVKPGDLVFDIGANIGNRTRVFASMGARVVAVEPLPQCYWALRWMFKCKPNVTIIGAAASYDESPKRLTEFEIDTISTLQQEWIIASKTSGRFGKIVPVRELSVACVTLDCLIDKFGIPAFTKIDVEGSELDVLRGLSRSAGTLSFEVTPELLHLAEQCLERLEMLGYRNFQCSIGETMTLGKQWFSPAEMRDQLGRMSEFGDIYALAPAS
jgi:FkbM family methyltransferase